MFAVYHPILDVDFNLNTTYAEELNKLLFYNHFDFMRVYTRKKKNADYDAKLPVNLVLQDLHLYLKLLLLRLFHQIQGILQQRNMLLSLFWAKVHAQENLDPPRQPYLKFDLFSLQYFQGARKGRGSPINNRDKKKYGQPIFFADLRGAGGFEA